MELTTGTFPKETTKAVREDRKYKGKESHLERILFCDEERVTLERINS